MDHSGVLSRIHHVGVVVGDVGAAAEVYRDRFGYEVRSPVVHDPAQTAYVQFLALPGERTFLELVAPDRPDSKLSGALARGGGLNHVCYSTRDIDRSCRELRARGMLLLQPPVAAAAFPGRRIAWLIGEDRVPVELVEEGQDGEL